MQNINVEIFILCNLNSKFLSLQENSAKLSYFTLRSWSTNKLNLLHSNINLRISIRNFSKNMGAEKTEVSQKETALKVNTIGNRYETNEKEFESKVKVRENYQPDEAKRILKNLIALALSFVFLFTAFTSMSHLQSSLNEEGGLGAYSLAMIYVGVCLSSLFLPSLLIKKFTCKWTIVFSMTGYVIYIAAQFYPSFATLIPAAFILGVCAAPLWSAHSIYLAKIGEEYGYLTSTSSEIILQRFFGLFFLFFHSSQVWGNLISSLLLSSVDNDNDLLDNYSNHTIVGLSECGVNHCPLDSITDTNLNGNLSITSEIIKKKPNMEAVYLLSGIFLFLSIISAVITWLFVDSLARYGENEESASSNLSAKQLALATIKHWKNPYQLLLIPATIWQGVQAGFIGADFNLSYVACAWGVKYIGYTMISLGAADGVSSFLFGRLTKYSGRIPVFILSAVTSLISLFVLLNWSFTPENPEIFFIVAALWGLADGIWLPQINALYGTIFPDTKEAGFSNNRFWTSVGFVATYVSGTKLCMETKLWFCIALILLSLIGYLLLEVKLRLSKQKNALSA